MNQAVAHNDKRRVAEIGEVRYQADHASASFLRDPTLCQAEETHVKVIQIKLLYAPLRDEPFFVRLN
jgi:hypothetical protein